MSSKKVRSLSTHFRKPPKACLNQKYIIGIDLLLNDKKLMNEHFKKSLKLLNKYVINHNVHNVLVSHWDFLLLLLQ